MSEKQSEERAQMTPPRQAEIDCSGCGKRAAVWFWGPDGRCYCHPCAKTRKIIR